MKLEKILIFLLQFDLGIPRPNSKLIFEDVNFLSPALKRKDQQQFEKMKSEETMASSAVKQLSIQFRLVFFLMSILIIKRLTKMFCFQACFLSKHVSLSFLRKLQLSCFFFSVTFLRSTDQTKQTLAVSHLFQGNFLLVLGTDDLV